MLAEQRCAQYTAAILAAARANDAATVAALLEALRAAVVADTLDAVIERAKMRRRLQQLTTPPALVSTV